MPATRTVLQVLLRLWEDFQGPKDSRMTVYPLMDSAIPTFIFVTIYITFVTFVGPFLMRNRKPFELRSLMVIYNIMLVAVNAWIVLNLCYYGWFNNYSWKCQPIDFSYSPIPLKLVQISWVFYVSKLLEFFDTVFFVLRKKTNQINKLHVFHHTTVPITAWYAVCWGSGGYNLSFETANAFVHIWMYLYYGLSAMGPQMQKYLWWKKYLTSLQLAQFAFVIGYFSYLATLAPRSCKVSPFLVFISLGQAAVYFILFMNFYLTTYKAPRQAGKKSILEHLEEQNGHASKWAKKQY